MGCCGDKPEFWSEATKVTTRENVSTRVKEILHIWFNECVHGSGGLPSFATETAREIYTYVTHRDDDEKTRKYPLVTATGYGAWFSNLPIEIFPDVPSSALSKITGESIKKMSAQWSSDSIIEVREITDDLLQEQFLYELNESDSNHVLWLAMCLLLADPRPWSREYIYNKTFPAHSDYRVRSMYLSIAYIDLPWVPAEEYLHVCTHDTDEHVFLKAFRICGKRKDERSMDDLMYIVRSPASVVKNLSEGKMFYPVGHAACSIIPAQIDILGTDDPAIALNRETQIEARRRRPIHALTEPLRLKIEENEKEFVIPAPIAETPNNLEQMIKIPEGYSIYGANHRAMRNEPFDWERAEPQQRIHLDEFYIDKFPVTNAQYDAWVEKMDGLSAKEKSKFTHPGQPSKYSHRRSTFFDERFKESHPVVGIDWFDAWAYARYHGKQLPNEKQWEKAARGEEGIRYPWGNEFNENALRWAGETYGVVPQNHVEWISLLSHGVKQYPVNTTAPVDSHKEGVSPFGVWDMCGNCWEFTRTAINTSSDARTPYGDLDPRVLMAANEAHVVIKGGAWSSPAPLISANYRGYDLLTDRHTEIGFRCIWEPKENDLDDSKTNEGDET